MLKLALLLTPHSTPQRIASICREALQTWPHVLLSLPQNSDSTEELPCYLLGRRQA